MKKYFFDCGTHMFQGFNEFSIKYQIDSSWYCYCFEPNQFTFHESKKILNEIESQYNIVHLNQAISSKNEVLKIKCPRVKSWGHQVEIGSFSDQSSNILETPQEWWNGDYIESEIEAIDFSEFLLKTVNKNDYVLVKMDIEGSEFSVLDKLIENDAMDFINDLYVEFHERHFENEEFYKLKKENYFKTFSEKAVNLFEWI